MQADTQDFKHMAYNGGMPLGRPTTKARTPFGEQLASARTDRGMTQGELAEKLGVTQRVITYWEREPVALKPEQLSALADALGVTTDTLLGRDDGKRRGTGPKGKAKLVFEEVSQLPRRQQEKILATVEDMLVARRVKTS